MPKFTYSLSLLVAIAATSDAFSNVVASNRISSSSSSSSALQVSVVSSFLTREEAETKLAEAFETETPETVGVHDITGESSSTASSTLDEDTDLANSKRRKRRNRRKHNFAEKENFLREDPDTDFYTLHSSAVSHLHKDMPINDVIRAIKRAQNLHDFHDLGTIAAFLMDECDEHWGYGFRGSLLSRLAVAALHMNELDLAARAIETRRVFERPSMQPYESAAIVRGLMRVNQVQQAWDVLEDELKLPLAGTDLTTPENKEILKHRARTLASIASRHFHSGEPYVSARALEELGSLGSMIDESNMLGGELSMPWSRLVNAASDCKLDNIEHVDPTRTLPSDLTELVFDTMALFPCPGGEEECGLEDFLTEEETGRY